MDIDQPDTIMAAPPAPGPGPDRETVAPEAIDHLFDQADLAATLEQLSRTLAAHRRQLLLMWIAVLGLAGLLAFTTIKGVRDARLPG